jgi:hypothetical protein
MSTQLLAYCGLDCSQCPAYIATQAEDISKLTALAGEWFDGATDHTIILCDGCKPNGRDARIMKWCSDCPTRDCAMEREVENCAFCSDYGCPKLLKVFEHSVEAKINLDRIRALL